MIVAGVIPCLWPTLIHGGVVVPISWLEGGPLVVAVLTPMKRMVTNMLVFGASAG